MSAPVRLVGGVVLIGIGIVLTVGTGGAAAPFGTALMGMGASMATGAAAEMLQKPPKMAVVGRDLAGNGTSAASCLPVVYGTARLGIQRVLVQTTDKNRTLWIVGAICHGPVEAIDGIYIDGAPVIDMDGRVIPPSSKWITDQSNIGTWWNPEGAGQLIKTSTDYIGYIFAQYALGGLTSNPLQPKIAPSDHNGGLGWAVSKMDAKGDGEGKEVSVKFLEDTPFVVGDTIYYQGGNNAKRYTNHWGVIYWKNAREMTINKFDNENEDSTGGYCNYSSFTMPAVFNGQEGIPLWTDMHKGLGIAYVVVRLVFSEERFPGGIPNIEVLVRGRQIYDPRSSTTVFSDNPALVVRDYLTNNVYGMGLDSSEINDEIIAADASYCDEDISTPAGSGVTYRSLGSGEIAASKPNADGTATVKTMGPHSLTIGDTVVINRHSNNEFNYPATWQVLSIPTSDQFVVDCNSKDRGNKGTYARIRAAKRYTCNGVVLTNQNLKNNLEELLTSCRGSLVYSGGQYRTWIRRPTPSSGFILNEDNIIGDWELMLPDQRSMCNLIRMSFLNVARNYKADYVDFPNIEESSYYNGFLADDNGLENLKEVDLPFTTDRTMALMLGMILRRESRQGMAISVTAHESAFQLSVGDVIQVTHPTPGFSNKQFWVMGMGYVPGGTVRLTLFEYDSTAYDLNALDTTPFDQDTLLPNPGTCEPPGNLVITNSREGLDRVVADWTASPDTFLEGYELEFRKTADAFPIEDPEAPGTYITKPNGGWTTVAKLGKDVTVREIGDLKTSTSYDFRVRAFNSLGARSTWVEVIGHTISTEPNPVIGPLLFEGTPDGGDTDEGMIHVPILFEPNTDEVHIYSWESGIEQQRDPTFPSGPGLPSPEVTANRLAGIVRRPSPFPLTVDENGDLRDDWFTHFDIATTRGAYRKVLAFGVRGEARGDINIMEAMAWDGDDPLVEDDNGPIGTITNFDYAVMDEDGDLIANTARLVWVEDDQTQDNIQIRLWRDGVCLAILPAGTRGFDDENLVPGQEYYYQVQMISENGQTSPLVDLGTNDDGSKVLVSIPDSMLTVAEWADVNYPRGNSTDTSPSEWGLTVLVTWVELQWLPTNPRATTYIYQSAEPNGDILQTRIIGPGETSARIYSWNGDTSIYYYTIQQYQSGYYPSMLAEWRGAIFGDPYTTILTGIGGTGTGPGMPVLLLPPTFSSARSEPQNGTFASVLSFTNANGAGTTEIWAQENGGTAVMLAEVPWDQTSYTDQSFPSGVTVSFWLIANVPNKGSSTRSRTQRITVGVTTSGTSLARPTLNSVVPSSPSGISTLTLTFTNPDPLADTRIYRGQAGIPYSIIATVSAGGTTYADQSGNAGDVRNYYVVAIRSGYSPSPASNTITATFPAGTNGGGGGGGTLSAPYDIGSYGFTNPATGRGAVRLLFNNPSSEANTIIERRLVGASSFGTIATAGAGVSSYDDWNVSQDTDYEYRYKAVRTGYTSSLYSATVAVTSGFNNTPNGPDSGGTGGTGTGGGGLDPTLDGSRPQQA